jgi:hypothetical protein
MDGAEVKPIGLKRGALSLIEVLAQRPASRPASVGAAGYRRAVLG